MRDAKRWVSTTEVPDVPFMGFTSRKMSEHIQRVAGRQAHSLENPVQLDLQPPPSTTN
jgi:hypothetical protein